MKKIWQKNSKQIKDNELTKFVEYFTVGKDYIYDLELAPYDIEASKAHAEGLEKINILTKNECKKIISALDEIADMHKNNKFEILPEHEDCHTVIEILLTEKLGDLGKKIHTGRSRNDQVLVAIRMWERKKIEELAQNLKTLIQNFLDFAKKYEFVPMPGYTHTQRAMLSSIGMWAGSFAENLIFNLESLLEVKKNVNKCPLGSSAGFGVNFDLQREFVSKKLGFDEPITISLTAQNTRISTDIEVLHSLSTISATLSHFANDLIWFTTAEFNFFEVESALTTGSSIMPQKKNLDTAEILRGQHAYVLGLEFSLKNLGKNLISGYNRDFSLTKESIMNGFGKIFDMVQMANFLILNIKPKEKNLRQKCTAEIFATDAVNELVKKGTPFRDAYKKIGNNLEKLKKVDLDKNLKSKTHLGATGNLGLEVLEKKLKKIM